MADHKANAERIVSAYNEKNFELLRKSIAPNLDFAHFNRNVSFDNRDGLIALLQAFAADYMPDRRFEPAERIGSTGECVVREGWWGGTCAVDIPGFGVRGDKVRLKFCSVMRFSADGLLVEWKDHG